MTVFPVMPLPIVSGDLNDPDSLRSHGTILINGDSQFTSANGVIGGNGSIDNPYLIENWTIDATNNHGIHIENTDAYFTIRNCYVYNGTNQSSYNNGIYLKNSNNGTIMNNNLSKISTGIYLDGYCEENFIVNNNLTNCSNGVYLSLSDNTIIHNNSILTYQMGMRIFRSKINITQNTIIRDKTTSSNNEYGLSIRYCENILIKDNYIFGFHRGGVGQAGILFDESKYNIIDNNSILKNKVGIYFWEDSYYNTFTNNTLVDNIEYGIYLRSFGAIACNNSIDQTNTINGDPVLYFYEVYGTKKNPIIIENFTLSGYNTSSVGKIFLFYCKNFIIRNCTIENSNTEGIHIVESNNIKIYSNKISNNSVGIFYVGSENINVTENEFLNNGNGIYTFYSTNNRISNNKILESYLGIENFYSDETLISKNNISMCEYGIYLEGTTNDIITGNMVLNNNVSGILIYSLDLPIIINNTILGSGESDIFPMAGLNLTLIDTVFETVKFVDDYIHFDSLLMAKNHVTIKAVATDGAAPLTGADIEIRDNGDTIYASSGYGGTSPKTDSNGLSRKILVTDRIYKQNEAEPIENLTSIKVIHSGWEDIRRNVNMFKPHTEYFQSGVVTPNFPDFKIEDENIIFSDEEIIDNETIIILAKIFNDGNFDGTVDVNFYDGHPQTGKLIGSDSVTVSVGKWAHAGVEWTTSQGNHNVWVVLDDDDLVQEFKENNNIAFSSVSVARNWGNLEWLNPYPGGNQLSSVAWKPDGSYALIAGEGGIILKFDGVNFVPIQTYSKFYSPTEIAWKPDGSYALINGWNGPILKYDGKKIVVLSYEWRYSKTITWSPDGTYALFSFGSRIIKFDGNTFKELGRIDLLDYRLISDLKWHPDGNYILVTSNSGVNNIGGEIYKFDGSTFTRIFHNSDYEFNEIAWHETGDYALISGCIIDKSGNWRYTSAVWWFDGSNLILIYSNSSYKYCNHVEWNPDYDYAVILGSNGLLLKFDDNGFIDISNRTNTYSDLYDISWKPNSNKSLIVGFGCTILDFDGNTLNKLPKDRTENIIGSFYSVSWKNDGSSAFIVGWYKKVIKFEGNELSPITNNDYLEGLFDISWKPDDSYALIVGCDDDPRVGRIFKFDGINITNITSSSNIEEFRGVAWKPDGSYALIVGLQGSILKYDGAKLTTIYNDADLYLNDVAWKPDDSYALITGYYQSNRTGIVLKYDGSSVSKIFKVPDNFLQSISWKPDGSYCLIVGGYNVFKYDGLELIDLNNPVLYNGIFDVSWEPNGNYALITGLGAGYNTLVFDGYNFFELPHNAGGLMLGVSWCPKNMYALIVGSDGSILKFTPGQPTQNNPPMATLSVNRTEAKTGEEISFDAAGSKDDHGIADYYFDYGDGNSSGWVQKPMITYSFSQPGNYTATLKVRDIHGLLNTNPTTVRINISLNYRPPQIIITSPEHNATVNGTVNVTGTALALVGFIQYVEINIDNRTWIKANGTVNWSYYWDTTMYPDGVHVIYARAFDGIGFSIIDSVKVDVCVCLPDDKNDTIIDKDNDSIPDVWEIEYGLDPTNAEDALEDWDGDGFTNLDEFLSGTDPLDFTSFPGINLPPIADAGENQTVKIGELVILNASKSNDPDGRIINFTWNFNDGNLSYGIETTYKFENKGTYHIVLTVMDNRGNISLDTVTVIVEEEELPIEPEPVDKPNSEGNQMAIAIASIIAVIVILIIIAVLKTRMETEDEEVVEVEEYIEDEEPVEVEELEELYEE
jgi:parallel beta-helix repeat protein